MGNAPDFVWPLGDQLVDGPPPLAAVGVGDLRAANAAAVLGAIRAADLPPRVATLAEATGLSRPTVDVIVDDLIGSGLVEEAAAPPARGLRSPGRPARLFRFRPSAGFVLSVDVRSRMIRAGLADLDGRVVAGRQRAVRAGAGGRARAGAVVAAVNSALEQAGVPAERVCAATVGTPGVVDPDNARIRQADNLEGWADADVAGVLGAALGCPVAVENDANLAALGEHWQGAGTTVREMMFILLGERLGAGIITGGRLLRGHHGAAGEIGFIHFPLPASAGGGSDLPGLRWAGREADVIAAAAAGAPEAVAVLESIGRRLAEGVAPVLLALDPALVVVGTGLFADPALAAAAELVRGAAERQARSLLVDPPEWQLSRLADDAILTGGFRFGLAAVERILSTRPTSLF
ncbi:transcriptional regulator [Actinoplanes sp. ATCC 53533]|uniref:ROK family transcriptional regulator n=1 Tax=Actinoplanes sp. ATCC 53533 TaxID=1288362 RepID=UPI000F7A911B|nr:ROK family transcriptional regulator [Actinoplanes sp. ATCC 53533]RSM69483.1 transcriptional regulator [Actinoplanes sp. ATCC 53533]